MKTIADSAFSNCTGLADKNGFVIVRNVLYGYYGPAVEVTVPDGVTRIGGAAFMNELGCALENVTIPAGVTEIGDAAFDLCNDLKTVTYLCDRPKVGKGIYARAAPGLESRVSPYVAGWGDVLKAGVWQERPIRVDNSIPEPPPIAPLVYTVTFNANGGTLASGSVKRSVESGKAVGALKANARFHVDKTAALWSQIAGKALTAYLPDGLSVENGAKWAVAGGARPGKVVYQRGTTNVDAAKLGANPSALKLTYKAKDGSFKGTFKVYADNDGRLKATTVNVMGVVLDDGVGYGTATIKKPAGSIPVTIK